MHTQVYGYVLSIRLGDAWHLPWPQKLVEATPLTLVGLGCATSKSREQTGIQLFLGEM